jgi:hypothetical protein
MTIEFSLDGKTYQCAASPTGPVPPPTFHVIFKPLAPAPAFLLRLAWAATDEERMVEVYEPVAHGAME